MKFNSQQLQKSFDTAKPILDAIEKSKNAISDDIKQLEAYFKSIGINELHEYTIKNPHAASSFTLDESDNNPFNTSGTSIGEKLYWNRDEKRLYYVSLKFKAYLSSHANSQEILISTDAPETTMKRPLIETPFDIRKDIYINNHLGSFLSEIAEKFKLNDVVFLNSVGFSDDCPF